MAVLTNDKLLPVDIYGLFKENIKGTFANDEDRLPYSMMFIHDIDNNKLNSVALVSRVYQEE